MQHPVSPGPALHALARTLSDPAFLAALCHDLRGPLGAIGTWIQVLGSERADAATREQALAAMRRDVAAQGGMIEQLADLASLIGGTLVLECLEVDLASVAKQLGSGLRFEGPRAPCVLADPRRLTRLLDLLLPAPATDAGANSGRVLSAAEDSGTCVIQGLARKGGPTLVGLTLARALAEVQSGTLALSETPEGTAFVLRLRAVGSGLEL